MCVYPQALRWASTYVQGSVTVTFVHPLPSHSSYLSVCLSVCLSVWLAGWLAVCHLPIHLFIIYLSVYLSIYVSIYLSIYLSVYLSMYLPIYLLSIYLHIYAPDFLKLSMWHSRSASSLRGVHDRALSGRASRLALRFYRVLGFRVWRFSRIWLWWTEAPSPKLIGEIDIVEIPQNSKP